jgi:uncharacterized protein YhaN
MRRKLAMDERLEELRRQLDQKTTEIESLAAAIKAWAASKIWNRLSTKGWSRPWRNCLDGGKKLLKRKVQGASMIRR